MLGTSPDGNTPLAPGRLLLSRRSVIAMLEQDKEVEANIMGTTKQFATIAEGVVGVDDTFTTTPSQTPVAPLVLSPKSLATTAVGGSKSLLDASDAVDTITNCKDPMKVIEILHRMLSTKSHYLSVIMSREEKAISKYRSTVVSLRQQNAILDDNLTAVNIRLKHLQEYIDEGQFETMNEMRAEVTKELEAFIAKKEQRIVSLVTEVEKERSKSELTSSRLHEALTQLQTVQTENEEMRRRGYGDLNPVAKKLAKNVVDQLENVRREFLDTKSELMHLAKSTKTFVDVSLFKFKVFLQMEQKKEREARDAAVLKANSGALSKCVSTENDLFPKLQRLKIFSSTESQTPFTLQARDVPVTDDVTSQTIPPETTECGVMTEGGGVHISVPDPVIEGGAASPTASPRLRRKSSRKSIKKHGGSFAAFGALHMIEKLRSNDDHAEEDEPTKSIFTQTKIAGVHVNLGQAAAAVANSKEQSTAGGTKKVPTAIGTSVSSPRGQHHKGKEERRTPSPEMSPRRLVQEKLNGTLSTQLSESVAHPATPQPQRQQHLGPQSPVIEKGTDSTNNVKHSPSSPQRLRRAGTPSIPKRSALAGTFGVGGSSFKNDIINKSHPMFALTASVGTSNTNVSGNSVQLTPSRRSSVPKLTNSSSKQPQPSDDALPPAKKSFTSVVKAISLNAEKDTEALLSGALVPFEALPVDGQLTERIPGPPPPFIVNASAEQERGLRMLLDGPWESLEIPSRPLTVEDNAQRPSRRQTGSNSGTLFNDGTSGDEIETKGSDTKPPTRGVPNSTPPPKKAPHVSTLETQRSESRGGVTNTATIAAGRCATPSTSMKQTIVPARVTISAPSYGTETNASFLSSSGQPQLTNVITPPLQEKGADIILQNTHVVTKQEYEKCIRRQKQKEGIHLLYHSEVQTVDLPEYMERGEEFAAFVYSIHGNMESFHSERQLFSRKQIPCVDVLMTLIKEHAERIRTYIVETKHLMEATPCGKLPATSKAAYVNSNRYTVKFTPQSTMLSGAGKDLGKLEGGVPRPVVLKAIMSMDPLVAESICRPFSAMVPTDTL